MTRILSELLHQANHPYFRQQLNQLERLNGHNNVDIRLTVEIVQAAKQKIRQLGLDQADTTGEELYQALLMRLQADDRRLERSFRTRAATHISAEADLTAGMLHALQTQAEQVPAYGIKSVILKKLLKKNPPKRLQKMLGYRSLDAMLRQESAILLVAAASHVESGAWQRVWHDAYKQLTSADFENRPAQVLSPNSARWQSASVRMLENQLNTVLGMPELGAVVLLPIAADHPSGMVVASLAFAMYELNAVAAIGNYLRAAQINGNFAASIRAAVKGQIRLETAQLPQAMPWQLMQRHFATTKAVINEDIFGPCVQAADFYWHDVGAKMAELCPALAFWQDTAYLTFIHQGRTVSLNILDAAINACNATLFDVRELFQAQQALWDELTLRYLDHNSLEQAVAAVLRPQLAVEMADN